MRSDLLSRLHPSQPTTPIPIVAPRTVPCGRWLLLRVRLGAARAYGLVRLASRERRRDALSKRIAAHALALNLTPVTHNSRDFADDPNLRIENRVG
jgi:tRNA(fMet)-specific endonuclease VapC